MAAAPNQFEVVSRNPNHIYHASADIFRAKLEEPIQRTVDKQAFVDLPQTGGYEYQKMGPFRIEGLMSYQSGYTQVAGNPSTKHGGVSTLATSVLEGFNVLDILTADRVVAQIFTEHPERGKGHVPSVSFLGTRFDNLRISGHKVGIEQQLDILGPKPDKDESYFVDKNVLKRVGQQYSKMKNVPDWAKEQYDWNHASVQDKNEMKCSLFEGVSGTPGLSFGHVIDLPFFGKIFLGELTVTRELTKATQQLSAAEPEEYYYYKFHLTMIRLKLGCPVVGPGSAATAESNGGGSGSGGSSPK
jgi:hypothetical protein